MNKWNRSWKASKQPRKQRAYVRNALLHVRSGFIASHLSRELRQKHGRRSARLRVGDKVKVLRGSFKNKTGTVERVDAKRLRVYVTGIELVKRDGSRAMTGLHPSNLLIQELVMGDKKRFGRFKQ